MGALRRLVRDERGVSLTEVMVSALLISIITAAFYTVFVGFMGNVRDEQLKSQAQDEGRLALSLVVVDIRQALDLVGDGEAVTELQSISAGDATDRIEFYSDRLAFSDGPERYAYELRNCVAQICELWQELTYATPPAVVPYVYPVVPTREMMILENVVADGTSVFTGVQIAGAVQTPVAQCDGTIGNRCSFALVEVVIRVDPDPTEPTPRIIEFTEQVRMRNAST